MIIIFSNNESLAKGGEDGPDSLDVEPLGLLLEFEFVVDVEGVDVGEVVPAEDAQHLQEIKVYLLVFLYVANLRLRGHVQEEFHLGCAHVWVQLVYILLQHLNELCFA